MWVGNLEALILSRSPDLAFLKRCLRPRPSGNACQPVTFIKQLHSTHLRPRSSKAADVLVHKCSSSSIHVLFLHPPLLHR